MLLIVHSLSDYGDNFSPMPCCPVATMASALPQDLPVHDIYIIVIDSYKDDNMIIIVGMILIIIEGCNTVTIDR